MPGTGINSYVEAATSSSDRGRVVLLVLITASVLSFMAFWNTRQGSWLNSRLHMARIVETGCPSNADKPDWDQVRNRLQPDDRAFLPQAREFYENRHIHSCAQLAELVKDLEDVQTKEINFIKIPFFGVQLDVNDLGMLGGFALAVAVIWFRSSLAREYENLKLCFDTARFQDKAQGNELLQACYELLAMRQVLTTPRSLVGQPPSTRSFLWSQLVLALYWLPLGVQAAIVYTDLRTSPLGWSVSHGNTIFVYSVETSFLLLIFFVTFSCRNLAKDIDNLWDKVAEELHSH